MDHIDNLRSHQYFQLVEIKVLSVNSDNFDEWILFIEMKDVRFDLFVVSSKTFGERCSLEETQMSLHASPLER